MMAEIGDVIPCGSTRNFKAGTYLAIGGGIGVTRSEAQKELETLSIPEGFTPFVTTYNEGQGHFVILVPNNKAK